MSDKQLMFACVEKKHGMTFCNRIPSDEEFKFSPAAAEHVVQHYDPRTMRRSAAIRLAGCIACIDNAKEFLAKENAWRLV